MKPLLSFVGSLCLLIVAGCQATDPVPTAVIESTAESEPEAAAGPTFQNPVILRDFPDPGIILVEDTYYAYSTNAAGRNVPVASSTDLLNWTFLGDAMPALPSWARLGGSFIWAPEVIEIDGRYLLYFTARDREADRQCIGVAISDQLEGRFRDDSDAALVCQVEEGGSIDASPFRDADGTLYLYWKNDGNCCNQATYIYVQQLSTDGLSLVGEPTRLIRNQRAWERHLIEAPTMWLQDGRYYLFFSANDYGSPDYAVGYAVCETAVGPCQDAPENPILSSVLQGPTPVIGPGHQTIVRGPGGDLWLAYHAWQVTSAGTRGSARFMWLDRLVWEEGKPVILGPTTEPQPAP
jgi:beta-xylosidase